MTTKMYWYCSSVFIWTNLKFHKYPCNIKLIKVWMLYNENGGVTCFCSPLYLASLNRRLMIRKPLKDTIFIQIHSHKKSSSMVLQNGQKFYLEHFAIWTRLRDLQTILSCEEPYKVLHFPVKNLKRFFISLPLRNL